MRTDGISEDDDREHKTPCLDFGQFVVPFPERGHRGFVAAEDLSSVLPAADGTAKGMWLFRAESGVCGVAGFRVKILRDGQAPPAVAILHHGQKVRIDDHEARFLEIRVVTAAEGSRLLGRKCPYCKKTHELGEKVYRCPLCGAGYCDGCWKELDRKRCCSRNCHFSPGALPEA